MANIKEALKILYKAEFNKPSNALEINQTEDGYTFMGIYQKANPTWSGWNIVRQKIQQYNRDMKLVSKMLYDNEKMQEYVEWFYKREYWDRAKLDRIDSQNTANEIFLFGVNAGMYKAITTAQEIVGVVADGAVGEKTIKALNSFDDTVFSITYDVFEKHHYDEIIKNNPSKVIFANGWKNRAELV